MFFARVLFCYILLIMSALCCAADKTDKDVASLQKSSKSLKKLAASPEVYISNQSHRTLSFWFERQVKYTKDDQLTFITHSRSPQVTLKPCQSTKLSVYHPGDCFKHLCKGFKKFQHGYDASFDTLELCPLVLIGIRIIGEEPEVLARLEFDIEKVIYAAIECSTENESVSVLSSFCERTDDARPARKHTH